MSPICKAWWISDGITAATANGHPLHVCDYCPRGDRPWPDVSQLPERGDDAELEAEGD